jgi:aminoglycoside phosphotransferase family enzyme/predicted kinase
MMIDDQSEVIDCLTTPATYGAAVSAVERIDTHGSTVFLAGPHAYKLKRAVRYDYMDFSSAERRRMLCEAELALNRRTAPRLYLDVVPVTREADGRVALGGAGTPLDWVLRMHRFDQDALFDRLAARDALALELMPPLAEAIARLHARAESRPDRGGREGMTWVVDGNEAGFAEQGAGVLDADACEQVTAASRAAIARHGDVLDARRAAGFVRVCHGDLHLRNIVLLDGQPTLFDAVEFNDDISCIDVLYDLAFLLMDLWRRGLRDHANALFNVYLQRTDRLSALCLLPLFLSCRSAVRAKTSASAARVQGDADRKRELQAAAREYLAGAAARLFPPAPRLVAVGGLSGTGKSTLARGLAAGIGAAPGAVVLRSDVIRKSLFGVSATTRLGPEGYTRSVSDQVYRTLAGRAGEVLASGHAVIVDAVCGRRCDRDAMAAVARDAGVPFTGLWLEAPVDELTARVNARRTDASDATGDVVRRQAQQEGEVHDWERLDASDSAEEVRRRAEAAMTRRRERDR